MALAEPGRAHALHKARLLNDASHDIAKATAEAEGMDAEERKLKIVAAAPAYLKKRVKQDKELPRVELLGGVDSMEDDEVEKEKENITLVVVKHRMGGDMLLRELYYDVMDMIAVRWDDGRGHA